LFVDVVGGNSSSSRDPNTKVSSGEATTMMPVACGWIEETGGKIHDEEASSITGLFGLAMINWFLCLQAVDTH
jgi:hypothetical protein